jgi:genome maintenance exonuclease 1
MFTHIPIPELPKIIQKTRPNGKRTYITPDGNEYPSVTTILGAKPKPHLDKWRMMLGNTKADKETKRCADRGTAVHDMAEKYLNNVAKPEQGHIPKHVDDYNKLRFALKKINNIRSQEVGLYSDMFKFAGTVDCVAEFMGILSVIDFKTSTSNKTIDMIDDYFKQCTAYAIAWFERTGEAIEDIVVLIAVEQGLAPLVYKDKIENWIPALLEDIDKFNQNLNK